MKNTGENSSFLVIIVAITALVIFALSSIPNYLKPMDENAITFSQPQFVFVFLIFNFISIGIFASFHWLYVKDYSKIKSIWFFSLFGGITGALLGEFGNLLMIIPYTILMFIYAQFYKRFLWWKVASTTYLAGILIENIMNRAPMQITTLMWVAFFIYPYFAAKIFENREKINAIEILGDFKFSFVFSIVLGALAFYFTRENISPPLIFLGITLPFVISLIYKITKRIKNY